MANYDEKKKLREKERMKAQKKQNRKWKKATGTEAATASYWLLAPLIIIFSFIPLIIRYYEFDTKLGGFDWFSVGDRQSEIFTHGKMVMLIVMIVYMLGALVYMKFVSHRSLPWCKMLIPLAIYGGLTILSTIVSANSYFSFNGIVEQFEPVWILLGYCIIVYYTYAVLQTEEDVMKLVKWFVIGIMLMLLVGLTQASGHDLLHNKNVQSIFSLFGSPMDNLEFKMESNRVYLTLANPNNVAGYMLLTIPFLAGLFLAVKKNWQKVLLGIMLLASLIVLYMSQSKAGILALVVVVILMAVLYRKAIKKHWIWGIGIFAVLAVAMVGINAYNHNVLTDSIKAAFQLPEENYPLKSIETKKDRVRITYNNDILDFFVKTDDYDIDNFELKDGKGNQVASVFDESTLFYVIQDERFPFRYASVRNDEFNGFAVEINGYRWLFSNRMKGEDTSFYAYFNGKPIKLKKDQTKYNDFLYKHQRLFSGRGHIWLNTIPLLKEYFLLGSGPDTFIIAYPNEDLVSKVNIGYNEAYITKPHSMYLQIATQTGVPSLICLLVFLGWYLVDSFKLYWKMEPKGGLHNIGMALIVSTAGFLVTSLTNDSFIGVTPLFYMLVGMGIAINQICKKRAKVSENHMN